MRLEDFNYRLPSELVAQQPAPRRDDARMLVVDRAAGRFEDAQFRQFPEFFEQGEWSESLQWFGKASEIEPGNAHVRKQVTVCKRKIEEVDQESKRRREEAKRERDRREIEAAKLYEEKRKQEEKEKKRREAQKLHQDANRRRAAKDYKQAAEMYTRVIELDPDHVAAYH